MGTLEEVFGGKNKIKLLRFLAKNKDWQFNLSEISKKIKVDKGSISKLIKDLEKNHFIKVKRSGKLLLFKLDFDNESISKLIVPIFEIEDKTK
jgi:predicted transcriptional regulator